MNKAEIKQIILEEIQDAVNEMEMGGEAERLAAEALMGGEEFDLEEEEGRYGRKATSYQLSGTKIATLSPDFASMDDKAQKRAIAEFMIRVNNILRSYRSPGARRPKKRYSASDIKNLVILMQAGKFTSEDIINAVEDIKSVQQANKFLSAIRMKGFIEYADDPSSKSSTDRPKPSALSLDDLDLEEGIKKYIAKQIKEGKSPLSKKMKEIESRGQMAALETKLSAVQEMIDETEERLTRIDEDNEFSEMMDKNAVKDVRKQLKELERAKAKIEKERDKMEGKMGKMPKKEKVVDEDSYEDPTDEGMTYDEDTVDEDSFELNESIKRMQKLANLRG